jgi:cobalt-zinc-cadmium efflux system outer membrane protein
LVAEQARFEQREQTIRVEHAKALPWFKINAGPRYRKDASQPQPNDFSVGVSVFVPILDQNQGPIRSAEALRDQERDLFRKLASSIPLEVEAALEKLTLRRKTLDRYRTVVLPGLGAQEKLLATAAAGGQMDVVTVLRAEDAILRARREYIEMRVAHHQAWLSMERVVGVRIAGEGPATPAAPPEAAPFAPAPPALPAPAGSPAPSGARP